mmetsp:Transcript_78719/g.218709  ORF Transcript_78719/g.218709 Transcript_78719/m.218709 type:complete len:306 (-) Transcript_78719:136-1053(-)
MPTPLGLPPQERGCLVAFDGGTFALAVGAAELPAQGTLLLRPRPALPPEPLTCAADVDGFVRVGTLLVDIAARPLLALPQVALATPVRGGGPTVLLAARITSRKALLCSRQFLLSGPPLLRLRPLMPWRRAPFRAAPLPPAFALATVAAIRTAAVPWPTTWPPDPPSMYTRCSSERKTGRRLRWVFWQMLWCLATRSAVNVRPQIPHGTSTASTPLGAGDGLRWVAEGVLVLACDMRRPLAAAAHPRRSSRRWRSKRLCPVGLAPAARAALQDTTCESISSCVTPTPQYGHSSAWVFTFTSQVLR